MSLGPVMAMLLCCGLVVGNTTEAGAADPAIEAAETSVRLGLTAGYNDFQGDSGGDEQTETGPLVGLTAGVSALSPGLLPSYGLPDLYTDVSYDFSAGFSNEAGGFQNRAGPSFAAQDDAYFNTAIVRLGAGVPLSGGREIIPYVAAGYQNWYRNIGGPAGYGAFYQAELVGGGLRLDFADGPALVVSGAAEGFAVIGGSVSAPSQDFNGSFGASAEERVSLDADYRLSGDWHAFAGLGVTHYEYAGSRPNAAGAFEPLSTTVQVNSMFGLAYGF